MGEASLTSVTIASLASLPLSRAQPGRGDESASRGRIDAVARASEARPVRVGRYTIHGLLGAGGMGVVYEARDPELDRAVAIKLVRPRDQGRTETRFQERLLREGKAMARLSHPNVVTVHDVGFADGVVFVAMELVQGPSLRAWLRERPRGWREVVGVFMAASRGLEAAHAVGLIHRDFKPSNVLIGDDGRPRIADFGLVRLRDGEDDVTAEADSPRPGDAESVALTRVGAVMGTPVYMSPEQHRGELVDARSDQFSLCVALWEALYGAHPFAGESVDATVEEVARGSGRPRGGSKRLPRWLRATLNRGLSRARGERWPSIDALRRHVERRLARRRRVVVGVGAGLGVAGVSAATLYATSSRAAPCDGIEQLLGGAWSESRAEAVTRAAVASETMAPAQFESLVRAALDRYAGAWSDSYAASCQAHAIGGLSDASYDRRVQCLEERRAGLASVASLLEEARPEVVARGAELVEGLPALATCEDEAALARGGAPPADGEDGARVKALRVRLAELRPRMQLDDSEFVGAALRDMSEEVARLDDASLSIDYEILRSDVLDIRGEREAAREGLLRALELSLSIGADYSAALTATNLVLPNFSTAEESRVYAMIAPSLAAKAGPIAAHLPLLAELYGLTMAESLGPVSHERFEALAERTISSTDTQARTRVHVLVSLASAATRGGRLQDAITWADVARRLAARELGDVHPDLTRLNYLAAEAEASVGDFEAARAYAEEGLRVVDALGQRPLYLVPLVRVHAVALEGLGEFDAALAALDRAATLLAESPAPAQFWTIGVSNSRGVILDRLGRYAEARAVLEPLLDDESPQSASMRETARLTLADVELHDGQPARARALFVEAERWWALNAAPDGPMAIYAANGVALADLALGDTDAAIAGLERMMTRRTSDNSALPDIAQTTFALGRALWSRPRSRARARALVEESARTYAELGAGFESELAAVRRWQDERRASLDG